MRRVKQFVAAAVVAAASLAGVARGQTPLTTAFTYQGSLATGGVPASGTHDFRFRLMNAASGGAQVGSTLCADNVQVLAGQFTTQLDFGSAAFNGEARWLEIQVRADTTAGNCGTGAYTLLSPRQPLTAVPYALETRGIQVNDALHAGIGTPPAAGAKVSVVSDASAAGYGITVEPGHINSVGIYARTGEPGALPSARRAGVWGDAYAFEEDSDVGVLGTSLYGKGMAAFTQYGPIAFSAVNTNPPYGKAISAYASGLDSYGVYSYGAGHAFYGEADTSCCGTGIEVTGAVSAILHGRAILDASGDNALALRGFGETAFDMGIGHPAANTMSFRTGGAERGRFNAAGSLLLGTTASGNGARIYAVSTASSWGLDAGCAVLGENGTGVALEGLTDTGYGVVGACHQGGHAGYFNGRTDVTGAFTATTKSFLIDHPLDPANRYLEHSCVESDQRANLYRGNARLDGGGEAWVTLPDWFEALNENFSYLLTPVGEPMPGLFVAAEVKGNQFKIAGGSPGAKVSWQITGERRDAYSAAHPMVVDRDKGEDRGLYLHPAEHGMPEVLKIGPGGRVKSGN